MACFRPVQAWQRVDGGEVVFHEVADSRPLSLPCGSCVGCHMARSRAWAVRCMNEASLHEVNEFVTLTYDKEHVPELGSLQYRDFQMFIRALRLELGCFDVTLWHWLPRYFVAGEYGELNARPHFHALLFGVTFPDRLFYRDLPSGSKIYTSRILEKLWPHGFSSTGDVTFESAAYVARYVLKKVPLRGLDHDKHYASRVPEFCRMSLKPGIGAQWLERFRSDVYPNGEMVMRGGDKLRVPRYYDKLYERAFPSEFEDLKARRLEKGLEFSADCTPDRLAVREIVVKAALKLKKESL